MPASRPLSTANPDAIRPYRLLAIGGSAGAIPALGKILPQLPAGFPIPIVVVQHLSAEWESQLPRVLGFRTALRCCWAREGEIPQPGAVHVAPRGANLALTREGRFAVRRGPKPRGGWPSVDIFLASMAAHVGAESIAVVLSGMLYDGADGIAAVRRAGGATMVQHPRSATWPDMPNAAVDLGRADLMRTPAGIVQALEVLAERGVE
jgi:two-component system chemotaxis response regulator CheB